MQIAPAIAIFGSPLPKIVPWTKPVKAPAMALFKIGVFSPFILTVNNAFNPKNDPVTKAPTIVAEAILLAGDSTPNMSALPRPTKEKGAVVMAVFSATLLHSTFLTRDRNQGMTLLLLLVVLSVV